MPRLRRAQSILELCVLFVVIFAALIAMQAYMKRGLQGRWKESVDQLGDQYDPSMTGKITHQLSGKSSTKVTMNSDGTQRADTDNSTETKKGDISGSIL